MKVLESPRDSWQRQELPDPPAAEHMYDNEDESDSDDDDDYMSCCSVDSDGAIFDPEEDYTHEIKVPGANPQISAPDALACEKKDEMPETTDDVGAPESNRSEKGITYADPIVIPEMEEIDSAHDTSVPLIPELPCPKDSPKNMEETKAMNGTETSQTSNPFQTAKSESLHSKLELWQNRITATTEKQDPVDQKEQSAVETTESETQGHDGNTDEQEAENALEIEGDEDRREEKKEVELPVESGSEDEIEVVEAEPVTVCEDETEAVKPKRQAKEEEEEDGGETEVAKAESEQQVERNEEKITSTVQQIVQKMELQRSVRAKKEPLSPKQQKWKKRIIAKKSKKEQKKGLEKQLENLSTQDRGEHDSCIFHEDSSRSSTLDSIPETEDETVEEESPATPTEDSDNSSDVSEEEDSEQLSDSLTNHKEDRTEDENKNGNNGTLLDIMKADADETTGSAANGDEVDMVPTTSEVFSNDTSEDGIDPCEEIEEVSLQVLQDQKQKDDTSTCTTTKQSDASISSECIENDEETNASIETTSPPKDDESPSTICESVDAGNLQPESPKRKKWSKRIVANKERKEKQKEKRTTTELCSAAIEEPETKADSEQATEVSSELDEQHEISLCGDPSSWLKRSSKNKPWFIKPKITIESSKRGASTDGSDTEDLDIEESYLDSSNENEEAEMIEDYTPIGILKNEEEEEDDTETDSINEGVEHEESQEEEKGIEVMNHNVQSDDIDDVSIDDPSVEEIETAQTDIDEIVDQETLNPSKILNDDDEKEDDGDDDSTAPYLSEEDVDCKEENSLGSSSDDDTHSSHQPNKDDTEASSCNQISISKDNLSNETETNDNSNDNNTLESIDEASTNRESHADSPSMSSHSSDESSISTEEAEGESAASQEEVDDFSNGDSHDERSSPTNASEETSGRVAYNELMREVVSDRDSVGGSTKLSVDTAFSEILDLFEDMKIERNERTAEEVAEIIDVFREMKTETKAASIEESSGDSSDEASGNQEPMTTSTEQTEMGDDASGVFIETQNRDDDVMSALSGSMRTVSTRTICTDKAVVDKFIQDPAMACPDSSDKESFWASSSKAAQGALDSCTEQSLTTAVTSEEEPACIEAVVKDDEVAIMVSAPDVQSAAKSAEGSPTGTEVWKYLCCCTASANCKDIPWYVLPEIDPAANLEESAHKSVIVSRKQIMRDLSQSQISNDGSAHVMEMVHYEQQ